ncbi:hypothetical protein I4U23_004422 [Adineta vaga]|nr:hypothetical protein I4U23_004422 [Adineta vaga]
MSPKHYVMFVLLSWHNQDGSVGLWSDGSYRLWWPSGVGLWSYAEFLHTMKGRTTDKLYLPLRWAAIQTAKNKNNYKHTNYTDDQAWWANGAIRLEQYIRSIGDATVELVNASQAVIDDNIAHETNDCDGGILWYYGTPPPDDHIKQLYPTY